MFAKLTEIVNQYNLILNYFKIKKGQHEFLSHILKEPFAKLWKNFKLIDGVRKIIWYSVQGFSQCGRSWEKGTKLYNKKLERAREGGKDWAVLCHFTAAENLIFLLDLYPSKNHRPGYLLSLCSTMTYFFKEKSALILLPLLHSGMLPPRVDYLLTCVSSVPLSQRLNNWSSWKVAKR